MQTVVVVPLGRGYNHDVTDICDDAKERCRAAVCHARQQKLLSGVHPVLAVGPGREALRKSGPTMAVLMAQHIKDTEVHLPLLVNEDAYGVWGTLAEMRWVVATAQQQYDNVRFVFVTARVHDIRVQRIARWFFPGVAMSVVTSSDQAIPLWHEYVLAYPKLIACKFGVEKFAEWVRLVTALPIKQRK